MTSSKIYVDNYGVTRVPRLSDLPDDALLCAWRGHAWPDTMPINRNPSGYGELRVVEVKLTCECGRWRRDVFEDADNGDVLTRAYGGGTMLATGGTVTRGEARLEWSRRQGGRRRARAAAARKAKAKA